MGKEIGKVMLKIMGWALIIITLLLLILRIPYIQTKIAKYVASRLSKQLNTTVEIDKVAMNFVDNASLKGIYLEDLSQDTLLFSRNISVDVSFFKLLSRVVKIDKLSISGSKIHVQESPDSLFNFQFILDAFASEDSDESSSSTFQIDLDRINISDLSTYAELLSGKHIVNLNEAKIGIDEFDLDNQRFEFNKIGISEIEIESTFKPQDSLQGLQSKNPPNDFAEVYQFPLDSLPFEISIETLDLKGARISAKEEGYVARKKFDSRSIEIADLNLRLSNLTLNENLLSGDISKFSLNLNKELEIQEAKSKFFFSKNRLEIRDFSIKSPKNLAAANAFLKYDDFNDLINLDESVQLNLEIPENVLSLDQIYYFLPNEVLGQYRNKSLKISGQVVGNLKKVNVKDAAFVLDKSAIRASGEIMNPTELEALELNQFYINGLANYNEYAVLLPDDTLLTKFEKIGNINFDAILNGGLDTLQVDKLEIYTDALAEAKFSGEISNIDSSDLLNYELEIHHISSGYRDLEIFVDSLPSFASKFDTIRYSGQAQGSLRQANLNGGFLTSLGAINTNILLSFNDDFSDAEYQGRIALREFQLGDLLDNDSLENITLLAELSGSGLDEDSVKMEFDASIFELAYNRYKYRNMRLQGQVNRREISGTAKIEDKNLKLDLEAYVDANDSIPSFDFDLNLETLNLNELNLLDDTMQVQLTLHADMKGLNLDQADGEIVVKNIQLRKQLSEWSTDSIKLNVANSTPDKSITLEGDFVNASIEGSYRLSQLEEGILHFLDQYFPVSRLIGSVDGDSTLNEVAKNTLEDDIIDVQLEVYNITEVAQFFSFPVSKFDTASLSLKLDYPNNLSEFEFLQATMIYDGYYIENINARASSQKESLYATFSVDSVSITESIHLSQVDLGLLLKDQNAEFSCLIKNQKQDSSLVFTSLLRPEEANNYLIDLSKSITLNKQEWDLYQKSSLEFSNDGMQIPEIQINNGREAFSIQGTEKKIDLSFTDFDLSNIVEIVGIDSFTVGGQINGSLELGLVDETPINGDLNVDDIMFNEFEIGDLELKTIKEGQDVTAFLNVKGDEVLMEGDLSYDLSSSYLFGKVLVEKLNLEPFNPLIRSYADNLKGAMQGYIAIEGELEDPMITGALYFQEVEAFIIDLATKYRIKEGRINVFDDLINPQATLEDEEGRLSFLKGEISHDFFTNIIFDLDFLADEFLFLNSKQNKREYYYGDFVGKVDAKITGSSELPIITADITALSGTDFTIQLLSSEAILSKEDYILFYDGSEITTEEAIDSISRKAYQANSAVELNLNIGTTEDALFHVIVDPVTGDRLDIQGNSNLVVRIPAYGDISVVGDYIVKEGKYRVSYENTISRTFKLSEDSKISFQGDPSYAVLKMTAIYETEVNTIALLERSGSQISNSNSGSLRSKINVELLVEGTLAKPELSFDIKVAEASDNPIGNELSSALAQLRQNETQLLEQVGSLILFNSFTGSNSGGNISSMGTSTAISSVGNLIDNQLNKLASNADGFEIDFNIDQYKDVNNGGNANVTEFGIGLQQKLFNDRLIISAGGNANLETGQSSTNNFSSFAGDFVIQYLLSKDGKLRVRVFQKSDFNALSNDNIWKTGAGLTYKRKFGQIKPKE